MNENKFTGKADIYDMYRPSYPSVLIKLLYEKTGASTVADIGAGTGIFTKLLLEMPWKVTAVEPNADMREKLLKKLPETDIITASAEDTNISTHSIDLVTAAQAFHWFDKDKFKIECQRILTPNGHLAIIWNNRIETDMHKERNEIFMRFVGICDSVKGNPNATGKFAAEKYFSEYERISFTQSIKMNKEQYVGCEMSRSYSPEKGSDIYVKQADELKLLFDKYQKNSIVDVPYETECFLGKL